MSERELKLSVRQRIIKARTDGVPTGKIVNASERLTFNVIYGMIGAEYIPIEYWEEADRVLKDMGY